ncbi:MAG: hypothetical protein ACI35R_17070 [Bacillus sp. (in: firmicutes)]
MLIIKEYAGYEIIKEKPASPQDSFHYSQVVYIHNGEERTLHVLYLKYFEELLADLGSPFIEGPLLKLENRNVCIKDAMALIYLLLHPEAKERKRIYISSREHFLDILEKCNYNEVILILEALEKQQTYTV